MLIKITMYQENIACPILDDWYLNTETGGFSSSPVMSERGKNKECAVAQMLLYSYNKNKGYDKPMENDTVQNRVNARLKNEEKEAKRRTKEFGDIEKVFVL